MLDNLDKGDQKRRPVIHLIPVPRVMQAIRIDPWYKRCDDKGGAGMESGYRQETDFIPR